MRQPQIDPPEHLGDAGATFFREVQASYRIRDAAGLRLLVLACESLDTAESARVALAGGGLVYTDRFGAPRPRPEAAMQRNAQLTFARLVRELGLDLDGGK